MIWTVEWVDGARKELRKLDKKLQKDILKYLQERIATDKDPRRFGSPLAYDKYGLWRYRIQNARVVCRIYDNQILVLITKVGHRKEVYR